MMQSQYTYATYGIQPKTKDQEITELKSEVERLQKMLDSYDSDTVFYRDLVHTLYATHDQAKNSFRANGQMKEARFHLGHAVAYRSALEHFDTIRKIR